jgi:hypothetical protein
MDGIVHPGLQRLYQYWLEKRGERSMPSRTDIDPLDIRFAIGNVVLIDVIEGAPLQFRIRLHGTNLAEHLRYDMTGKMLDDMPQAEYRNLSRQSFTQVATTKKPLHAHRDLVLDDRSRRYETISLPLSSDDDRVDVILCALFYDDEA